MPLIDASLASTELGISRRTLYTWVKARRVSCVRVGDRIMFSLDDLSRWIAEHTNHALPIKERRRLETRLIKRASRHAKNADG